MNSQGEIRRGQIATMYGDGSGATLQEIGERFGVTRQRVHQVVTRPDLKEYHKQRREANLNLVAAYNPTPVCQRCREPIKTKVKFCLDCKKKIKIVGLVQHHLRKGYVYKHRGWPVFQSLNQAACLIRKHHLKPEDFQ